MTKTETSQNFIIRSVAASDRQLWEPLWKGYLDFYDKRISNETIELTWRRVSESGQIRGFLALNHTGEALGLIHYFFHPSTSSMGGNCYIQDLFVLPSSRKQGLGRQLITRVVESAKEKQVAVVYWQTEEFNGSARRLYEHIAKRSPFIRYQIDLV
jgi:GNAT superfamily N-acetyltransferase